MFSEEKKMFPRPQIVAVMIQEAYSQKEKVAKGINENKAQRDS